MCLKNTFLHLQLNVYYCIYWLQRATKTITICLKLTINDFSGEILASSYGSNVSYLSDMLLDTKDTFKRPEGRLSLTNTFYMMINIGLLYKRPDGPQSYLEQRHFRCGS